MKIFLIGFMGSGKSTLGAELANKFKYKFLDLDAAIEKSAGKTVSQIFASCGEEEFRKIEMKSLRKTNSLRNYVIATGGGTPCFFDNMAWMNAHGITVYLQIHPGVLFHRLVQSKEARPMISELNDIQLMEFIADSVEKRENFYKQAHLIINPNKVKTDQLMVKIKKLT